MALLTSYDINCKRAQSYMSSRNKDPLPVAVTCFLFGFRGQDANQEGETTFQAD